MPGKKPPTAEFEKPETAGWEGLIPFFGARDLETTHRFYTEVLGLSLYKDQGLCRIYEVSPGAWIGFCTHHPVVPPELSPMITLLTADVDQVHRRLEAAGIETDGPPRVNPRFRIYHFFALDPNGYKVEIQRFLD